MARASSVISVAITGDSKKLQGALKGADKGVKNFGSSMKGAALGIGSALAGVFAISKGFEFLQGSLQEADRLGDSVSNLNRIIGKVNTKKIQAVANSFIDIGLSSADVLELSVGFARIAKAIGLKPKTIANYATDVAAVAKALSLVDEKGRDAAFWVETIAKAAGQPKNIRMLRLLGISSGIESTVIKRALEDSGKKNAADLTEAEKNAARLLVIMRKLAPAVKEALANPDVELKQEILRAKIEELQGQLGTGLQPIVADILQNILDISKSEWVDDMVKGIEVLQGKHDVPIFEDLKTGIATVQAAFVVVNAEISEDVAQIQGWIGEVAEFAQEAGKNIGGVAGAIQHMAEDAAAPLARLRDLLDDILERLGLINKPARIGHFGVSNPVQPRGPSDREIADAIARQRQRNGLGR